MDASDIFKKLSFGAVFKKQSTKEVINQKNVTF